MLYATHIKKFKLYFIVNLESLDFKQRNGMHFKEED